ncbi:MAG: hypothetical protein WKF79_00490 [Nocardioides sp.]
MKITTAQTLTALRAIAALEFAPFGRSDLCSYAGADDDAQIACGADATLIADLTGQAVETGANTMEVVVSGDRVELYACTPTGDSVCVALEISRAI